MLLGYLCDRFITDDDVRENAAIFNSSVFAAAQLSIYSASKVLSFAIRNQSLCSKICRMEEMDGRAQGGAVKSPLSTLAETNKLSWLWRMTEVELGLEKSSHPA